MEGDLKSQSDLTSENKQFLSNISQTTQELNYKAVKITEPIQLAINNTQIVQDDNGYSVRNNSQVLQDSRQKVTVHQAAAHQKNGNLQQP